MRILVTGGSGQLGTDVAQAAAAKGWQVWAPDHTELDITQAAQVESAIGGYRPDWVVHCAAYTAVDRAETEEKICMAVNAAGTAYVAHACAAAGCGLLYPSTDYVFDGSGTAPHPVTERPAPLNVYGRSKLLGEQAAQAVPRHAILRISWVFGLHGNNFVKTMLRLAERRTAAETELNDTNSKLWEEYQLTESEARSQCVPFESLTELRRSVTEVRGKIRALGNVNVGAIDEYKEVRERYDFMKAQVTDVEKAKAELTKMIAELCSEMQELFTASFKQINANFQQIFKELFGGGHARLYLSDEANVLESGIEIEVSPPGKVIKNLSALSGGEQALVAISIYFAILRVNPAPFCFLDEIEAALDDVNVARYAQYLRRMTDRTQFIVITHRRGTMEAADVLYGVTMQEDGVSKILRLDLDNVSADLIT